jgi:hypothetical protein
MRPIIKVLVLLFIVNIASVIFPKQTSAQQSYVSHFRIYRPEVVKNNNKEMKPAPSRIANLKDVKQPSERNATNQPRYLSEKPSQPLNTSPSRNVSREVQPNNVKSQIIRKEAQQNIRSLNIKKEQNSNASKSSGNAKNEQKKKSNDNSDTKENR